MNPTPQGGGLLASLRNLLATAIAVLQTRLELFATEFEEEKIRLGAVLWFGLVAFFFLGFGVVFLALTLTVLLWDSHRLLVLTVATALFLVVGLIALAAARRQSRAGSRLFASSLAELAQDRAAVERQQQ